MNPLHEVSAAGQSPWLDFVRRTLITSGELGRLIDDGVTGVTSNPSIFGKAIGGSTDYDEETARIAGDGTDHDPLEVFEELAIVDIQMAADALRPLYDSTEGRDGFVSFEVEPRLARDTAGTIEAARRLWARLDRPNVLIKIPGTTEGLPAIEQAIADGINVNVTLLFAVEAYAGVAAAYQRGIERRVEAGEPVDRVASVASFFVSRVDSAVDAALPEGSDLRGTAAIANAKLAYERFRRVFSGERWERLAAAGARVQRPLWASTSTKNPAYRDTLYVEELVGPDTVNTMPMNTVDAVRDHGRIRPNAIAEGLDEAKAQVAALAERGISLDEVTETLLEEGIVSFAKDFDALLATIGTKLERVRAGRERQRTTLSTMLVPVSERLQRMDEDRIVERIWRKDHTVWKDDPTEITNRLGWLTVSDLMHERIGELETFAERAAADGLETAVLLGMGGSSLAPEVFVRTFGAADGALELIVLDTTHPATIERTLGQLKLAETLFIVASKSGGTTETLSHFAFFWERVPDGSRFVAITDPGTSLETLARDHGFRAVFVNPDDIGGRYSALSYFGLVPAALIGAPLHEVLDRAEEMQTASERVVPAAQSPGATLGATMGESARAGRDKLTIVLPDEVASFGSWVEQLIAESTGKEDVGVVPVVGEPLGPPGTYGDDRVFVAIGEHAGLDELENAGHPVVRLLFDGREQIGGEFFRWEMATAVAGHVLGINPFDQPNVQEAKDATKAILASGSVEDPGFDDLGVLLKQVGEGDYVAILAYLDRTSETEDAIERARLAIRDRYRVATTTGFGPRFLHSTGQLHKGGANNGVFIQVVDEARPVDVPIPGQPTTFGTLIDAQALGDLRSLRGRGRRVARVTLDRLMEVV
ncbi:MAG TPA: bifunctional transaldolase/phosoglucose isomerase [Actinomycetota bacterium]|nr:bifunctional transaldolase/phosoglucose isomerase [Actinomycetota bacterium]